MQLIKPPKKKKREICFLSFSFPHFLSKQTENETKQKTLNRSTLKGMETNTPPATPPATSDLQMLRIISPGAFTFCLASFASSASILYLSLVLPTTSSDAIETKFKTPLRTRSTCSSLNRRLSVRVAGDGEREKLSVKLFVVQWRLLFVSLVL